LAKKQRTVTLAHSNTSASFTAFVRYFVDAVETRLEQEFDLRRKEQGARFTLEEKGVIGKNRSTLGEDGTIQ
jgi:hypothetical protein